MAKQGISTGTSPNDGTGDSLLGGAVKVNSNFDEVYGKLGDGTTLFVGIVSSIAVDGALSISTSYGAPTLTGTANTAVINSRQIYTAGVSTFIGDVTAVGVNTFSSAGYDIAGVKLLLLELILRLITIMVMMELSVFKHLVWLQDIIH